MIVCRKIAKSLPPPPLSINNQKPESINARRTPTDNLTRGFVAHALPAGYNNKDCLPFEDKTQKVLQGRRSRCLTARHYHLHDNQPQTVDKELQVHAEAVVSG